jgi:type IV secretion system protein VirD4
MFPSAEQVASSSSLAFEPLQNAAGRVFLGAVGARMEERHDPATGWTHRFASGGSLCGVADDRNHFLLAPARSGKGRSHLIPILLTYPGSVVVIDPKGDLASTTAAYRRSVLGQRVVVLDPFHAASAAVEPFRRDASFNPLAGVDPDDADGVIDRADVIANSLVVSEAQRDDHWDNVASQASAAVSAHVLTSPLHEERRTLATVARLLYTGMSRPDPETPSDLEAEMRTNPAADGFVQAGAAGLFDKADRELASTVSTIRRHLNWLLYPRMQRVVGEGAFSLASVLTEPTTVYLSIPVRKLASCAGWLRLVINCLLAEAEAGEARRAHQVQQGGHRTLLIIDEMPVLGRMRSLEIAAGQLAGLGVKLYLVAQDLSQLQGSYPETWQTFLGNSGTVVIFGATDNATLQWAETRLGQTTVLHRSQSDGSYRAMVKEGTSGRSAAQHLHPLMTATEIARTFNRDDPLARQLVFSASHGPLIVQRVAYDQHPVFRALLARGGC